MPTPKKKKKRRRRIRKTYLRKNGDEKHNRVAHWFREELHQFREELQRARKHLEQ